MEDRARVPPGVSVTRVIAFVQGGLGSLSGLLLIFGGPAVARATGVSGPSAAPVVVAGGVVLLGLSALLIWGGVLLASFSRRARLGVLVYEWISVALGLVGLTSPGLGLLGLLIAGVAVYYLQFDPVTTAAFGTGSTPTPPTQA